MFKCKRIWSAVALATLLAGCGGGGEASGDSGGEIIPPTPSMTQLPLQIVSAEVGEHKLVAVYQNLSPAEGEILRLGLATLTAGSDLAQCAELEANGLEWQVTPTTEGTCLYQYDVLGGKRTQTYQLAVSASEQGILPTLSTSVRVNEPGSQNIVVPEGATLQLVTVLGQGEARVNEQKIEFTASATGTLIALYELVTADSSSQMGELRITVQGGASSNTAPVVEFADAVQLPNQSKILTPLKAEDADGDRLQLVSVSSPKGGRAISAKPDPTQDGYYDNTNIEFSAALPGRYTLYASYHDHNGGYTSVPVNVVVEGEMALDAQDATFVRQTFVDKHAFTLDLRSHVVASLMDDVEFLGAEIIRSSGGLSSNQGTVTEPTTESPLLTYTYPGKQVSGTVTIRYQVQYQDQIDDGYIWFVFGDITLPQITQLETDKAVDYLQQVTANSTCSDCIPEKTRYEWKFNGAVVDAQTIAEVPVAYRGDALTVSATPFGQDGLRGPSKTLSFDYPLHDISFALSHAKAKETESVILTYTGDPYSYPTIRLGASRDRQGMEQTDNVASFKLADGSLVDEVQVTQANQTFELVAQSSVGSALKGGLETDIHATYMTRSGVEEVVSDSVIFTTLTSPDTPLANRWGHMTDYLDSGSFRLNRPVLYREAVTGLPSVTKQAPIQFEEYVVGQHIEQNREYCEAVGLTVPTLESTSVLRNGIVSPSTFTDFGWQFYSYFDDAYGPTPSHVTLEYQYLFVPGIRSSPVFAPELFVDSWSVLGFEAGAASDLRKEIVIQCQSPN